MPRTKAPTTTTQRPRPYDTDGELHHVSDVIFHLTSVSDNALSGADNAEVAGALLLACRVIKEQNRIYLRDFYVAVERDEGRRRDPYEEEEEAPPAARAVETAAKPAVPKCPATGKRHRYGETGACACGARKRGAAPSDPPADLQADLPVTT